jgi:hypothetical protein
MQAANPHYSRDSGQGAKAHCALPAQPLSIALSMLAARFNSPALRPQHKRHCVQKLTPFMQASGANSLLVDLVQATHVSGRGLAAATGLS